jgi:hypothetical protein
MYVIDGQAVAAGRVDTTHQVTNPGIAIDGDTVRLTALVEAQHLLTEDRSKFALLKNPFDVELVRDGQRWVVRRMRIDNAWVHRRPHRDLRLTITISGRSGRQPIVSSASPRIPRLPSSEVLTDADERTSA